MKKKILTAGIILATAAACFAAVIADINGKWIAPVKSPTRTDTLLYQFKTDGQTLTGSLTGPNGTVPIEDGKINGDLITFAVSNGMTTSSIYHSGKIYNDSISMNVQLPNRTVHLTLTRKP